jgi:DNA-binding GntR family transcriptional regulator
MARRREAPYLEIVGYVRGEITSGKLAPGDQVPSASELCNIFGVSRGTALRALKVLRDEGVIEVTPGWGSFVVDR